MSRTGRKDRCIDPQMFVFVFFIMPHLTWFDWDDDSSLLEHYHSNRVRSVNWIDDESDSVVLFAFSFDMKVCNLRNHWLMNFAMKVMKVRSLLCLLLTLFDFLDDKLDPDKQIDCWYCCSMGNPIDPNEMKAVEYNHEFWLKQMERDQA